MRDAIDNLRKVHADVKAELDAVKKGKSEHGTPEQSGQIMQEFIYQDILNHLHSAIRKMEIMTKHLY